MRKLFTLALAAGLLLGTPVAARAALFDLSGTLTVSIGTLPPISVSATGVGSSLGVGATASVPASLFQLSTTTPLSPPLLILGGIGVIGANQPGVLLSAGTSGTMALDAIASLRNLTNTAGVAFIPLSVMGAGGSQTFSVLGLLSGTIFGNPFQLAGTTVTGSLDGGTTLITGAGFDNRTASGAGQIQLVSPTRVALGSLGTLPALATLTLDYRSTVPEPTTLALLGAGLAGLGVMGRRRS